MSNLSFAKVEISKTRGGFKNQNFQYHFLPWLRPVCVRLSSEAGY